MVESVQEPVDSFRALAEAYCALVEHVEDAERGALVERLAVLLPQLIHAASRLPVLEPDPDTDVPEISHGDWMSRFSALNAKLGEHADYWTTMRVHGDAEPEVVNLSLADDLADIWRDLAGGLAVLSANGATSDAVWEWRFNFRNHWGTHAVEALRAIHAARGS